jgi:hypothetical protein
LDLGELWTGALASPSGVVAVVDANVSSMQPVPQIAIAAHRAVSFAADGYHIMLEHPTRSIQPGDRVSLTLHFAEGGAVTVPFEVRRPDTGSAP